MQVEAGLIDNSKAKARRMTWLGAKRLRQRLAASALGSRQSQILFVAGVQRSGTNMVMDLLEADWATDVFHETDSRAFDNYELRSSALLKQLVQDTYAPITVFKALCECQVISALLEEFIGSRCVWVYRGYEAVAASHIKKWKQMPETIRCLVQEDNDTHGWRGRGMSESTRAELRSCYHEHLNNESACALFWYLRNKLYFEQHLDEDPRVVLLNYERLLAEPSRYTAALYTFAGLNYATGAADMIASPSKRVRRNTLAIDKPVRELCDHMLERLTAARQLPIG